MRSIVLSASCLLVACSTSAPGDTTPPPAPTINPTDGSVVMGTGEVNATVSLTDTSGGNIGSATVDQNGNWSFAPMPAIAHGETIVASATDAAGNTSVDAQTSVDSVAPPPPVIFKTYGQTLSGVAEAESTIEIRDAAQTLIGSTVVGSNQAWSTNLMPVQITGSFLSATATDITGNASVPSTTYVSTDPQTIFRPGIEYMPEGALLANTVRCETGTCSSANPPLSNYGSYQIAFAPDMRFPFESGPAFPNSQMWGKKGYGRSVFGSAYPPDPGGQEYDGPNYNYPWRDNFCETRGYSNVHCPSGKGHQGVDIRPASCDNNQHWVVAVESGQITNIGLLSITLVTDPDDFGDQRIYRYLHLFHDFAPGIVKGARVNKGDRLGRASDVTRFGNTSSGFRHEHSTTLHLHFELWDGVLTNSGGVSVAQSTAMPIYQSTLESYLDLLDEHPDQVEELPEVRNCDLDPH